MKNRLPFFALLFVIIYAQLSTIHSLNAQTGLGIDQSAPVSKLDVNGGITVGTGFSGTHAAPANGMIVEGNVGIGFNAPATFLDLRGTPAAGRPHIMFGNAAAVSGSVSSKLLFEGNGIEHGGIFWTPVSAGIGKLQFSTGGSADPSLNSVKMTLQNDGNLGIGTTAPAGRLDIRNGGGQSGAATAYLSAYGGWGNPTAGNAAHGAGAKIILWDDQTTPQKISVGMDGNADMWFNNAGAQGGSGFTFYTGDGASATPSVRLKIMKDGNIGIGTNSPSYKLHVSGAQLYLVNAGNTELMTTNTNGTVTGGIQSLSNQSVRVGSITSWPVEFVTNNTVGMTLSTSGNVGIGATAPSARLEVAGAAKISGGIQPDFDSGWIFINTTSVTNHTLNHNFGSIPTRVIFYTASSNNPTWVRVNNFDSKGIGYTNPETLWLSSSQILFSTCCNDYVVYCDSNNPCPPGEVSSMTGYIKVLLWK